MKKLLISYSQSPLKTVKKYLDDSFVIIDEKFGAVDFSGVDEIWLDVYIDLYQPKLLNPEYLYHFFARIHALCDKMPLAITKRMLRNYSYRTTYQPLHKVFYLYYSFTHFFEEAYQVYPIYIPDLLDEDYHYHPYWYLRNSSQAALWNSNSLFRVLHQKDIAFNLNQDSFEKNPVAIEGMKVYLKDIHSKISQIFGIKQIPLEEAYEISINDDLKAQTFSEINYNLESLLINQL